MTTNGHSITGNVLEEDAQFLEYQAKRDRKYGLAGAELEEKAPFELKWVDLAESTRDLPPTQWLVPGLITVGESTLLVGAPKGWQDPANPGPVTCSDTDRAVSRIQRSHGQNVVTLRIDTTHNQRPNAPTQFLSPTKEPGLRISLNRAWPI